MTNLGLLRALVTVVALAIVGLLLYALVMLIARAFGKRIFNPFLRESWRRPERIEPTTGPVPVKLRFNYTGTVFFFLLIQALGRALWNNNPHKEAVEVFALWMVAAAVGSILVGTPMDLISWLRRFRAERRASVLRH